MSRPPANILDRALGGRGSRYGYPALPVSCFFSVSLTNFYDAVFRSSTDSSVSLSAFAYLYSELVQYHQNRVDSISELERRLESSGYSIGLKILELQAYRSRDVRIIIDVFVEFI